MVSQYLNFSNLLHTAFNEGWDYEGDTFQECIEISKEYLSQMEDSKQIFKLTLQNIDTFLKEDLNETETMNSLFDLGLGSYVIVDPNMSNNATTYREWTQNLRNTLATEYEKMFGEKI